MTVSTYNGSFLGDNSPADAELHSLAIRYLSGGTWLFRGPTPSLRRLGRLVLELDSKTPTDSPCGPNCTYSIQFAGPYFRCTKEISNQSLAPIGNLNCGYNAFTAKSLYTPPYGGYFNESFNMTASRGIRSNNDTKNPRMIQETETLSCMPSWAHYKVNVSYIDGIQTITRSEKYMGSISDMMVTVSNYYPVDGVWSKPLVQWMTGLNHYALINALVDPLTGNYTMMREGQFWEGGSSAMNCGATDGLIIADTRFNTQRDNISRTLRDGPSFSLSQDVLNDALFNLTMSASFQLGFWETKVSGRISATRQFYSFESPITLVVPYVSCLVISIPFIVMGLMSLRSNGVSAIEGGFVQVLMTTTGSKAMHEEAAPGCMGGEENMPDVLKKMKVRFGELVPNGVGEDGDPTHVRRAGFGTDDEVVPLKRGTGFGKQ